MIDGIIAWLWWFAGSLVDAALWFFICLFAAVVWMIVSAIWDNVQRTRAREREFRDL